VTLPAAIAGLTDGQTVLALRYTWNPSVVTFYYKVSTEATVKADCISDTGWTQLGVTRIAIPTLFNSTSVLHLWYGLNSGTSAGQKNYYAQIAVDGTIQGTFDPAAFTGGQTSYTDPQANVWSILRSTSGRKSVAVVRPVLLLGTDDYLEVADNALLDFDTTDSFTAIVVLRSWNTAISQAILMSKSSAVLPDPGWRLYQHTSRQVKLLVSDATVFPFSQGATDPGAGVLHVAAGVRNAGDNTIKSYLNNVMDNSVADTTATTSANALPFRIGALASAIAQVVDMEFVAAVVARRALAAAEIAAIVSYYGAA
jgi:hypothetical protein